jgi:hypothetical protein
LNGYCTCGTAAPGCVFVFRLRRNHSRGRLCHIVTKRRRPPVGPAAVWLVHTEPIAKPAGYTVALTEVGGAVMRTDLPVFLLRMVK